MGRSTQLLILSSLSLVAGVALGQTGLIVEPWRKPPAAPAVPAQAMPASGLPPVVGAPRKPQPPTAEAAPVATSRKWSPPVVELLVDPWAKSPVATRTTPRGWVPSTVEIVDPWAGSQPVPRIASRRASPPSSPIF